MNSREMQKSFEFEIRQNDKDYEVKNKLQSDEIFYFLSRAERDYVQEIYDSGLDKNEENKKKLGGLLISSTISAGQISVNNHYPNSFNVVLPSNLLYTMNERANVTFTSGTIDDVWVKPNSYDEYNSNKDNPFRKSRTDKVARMDGDGFHIILCTPETVSLNRIYIDYVKTPLGINVSQNCELHESVHYNVIKGAVKLYMAAKQEQIGYQMQSVEEKNNK